MALTRLQRAQATAPVGLVPFKEVCQRLGIHYNTGYRNRHTGRFPLEILKVGSRYFCRVQDLDEFFRTRRAS